MECVGIGVEQLLTVGKLFKQIVLSGAYKLTVLDAALGVRCGFLAWIDLAVVPFIAEITFKKKAA